MNKVIRKGDTLREYQTAGLISEAGTGVSPVRRRATAWYGQVAIGFGPAGPA